jgi:EAL domain-containing protein (putative c-di-GMP-specific phosphodiesterase class I)
VDVIKIDRSFVAELTENVASHAIVLKTIEMTHLLDLLVVCQGVETAEQYQLLKEFGSDFCQGFYLSLPMTADQLDEITGMSTSAWAITV